MLRLPSFTYLQPRTLAEALAMKADAGPDGMYVAGGTDLYPNMKRRHQEPRVVISLRGIPGLTGCEMREAGCVVGSCMTLTDLSGSPTVRQSHEVVARHLLDLAERLGQAPVDHRDLAELADDHVGRLEIAVDHPLRVRVRHRVGHRADRAE